MKKMLMVAIALSVLVVGCVAVASSARSADLPLKAAPNAACPYLSSGFYFGLDAQAGVQTTKSNGLFLNNLVSSNLIAAGGAVGGTVGYMWGTCTNFWAVEGTIDYQNISGSGAAFDPTTQTATPTNSVSKWQSNQVVKWGGFSSLLSYLPNFGISFPTLPMLPVGLTNVGTSHAYLMAGVQEFGISGALGSVNGSTWGVAPLIGMGTLAPIVDTNGKPNGAVLDLYAKVVFENKGLTLDRVFSTSGPPTVGASSHLDKAYFAGMKITY